MNQPPNKDLPQSPEAAGQLSQSPSTVEAPATVEVAQTAETSFKEGNEIMKKSVADLLKAGIIVDEKSVLEEDKPPETLVSPGNKTQGEAKITVFEDFVDRLMAKEPVRKKVLDSAKIEEIRILQKKEALKYLVLSAVADGVRSRQSTFN